GMDLERANRYFETVELDPRPKVWPDGSVEGADWDFMGTNLLRTLLDFSKSDRLSAEAKAHLTAMFTGWVQHAQSNPRQKHFKDNDRAARYPAIFTENHDLMCLTIGYFGEVLAARDAGNHEAQLAQSLSWRFRRGWTEWHSPCYQNVYLSALLILADHAPNAIVRQGASDLANVQLAERAALSICGYLGGPFSRGYDAHIVNDRNDSYLPAMWMAFGLPDKEDCLLQAPAHFASSGFEPHPAVIELAGMPARTPTAYYRGTRDCSTRKEAPRRTICYYNTPHVSMGSMRACGSQFQARFFNIMFAADPSRSLRTYLRDSGKPSPWYPRHERGEVVQHQNWLIARGGLVEEGGLAAEPAGAFRVYRVRKGLCAHLALAPDLHVFQVGDLDMYADSAAFVASLSVPAKEGGVVRARTSGGDNLVVDLTDMSMTVNGRPGHDWSNQLHAGPWLFAEWDRGKIDLRAGSAGASFSDEILRRLVPE
ncbi:MAG: hypothetical protein C0404_06765, partial [Verrucomicrobia bacterium]|nr:hypothetical protein [Verrucomicrobiota bacterium]